MNFLLEQWQALPDYVRSTVWILVVTVSLPDARTQLQAVGSICHPPAGTHQHVDSLDTIDGVLLPPSRCSGQRARSTAMTRDESRRG